MESKGEYIRFLVMSFDFMIFANYLNLYQNWPKMSKSQNLYFKFVLILIDASVRL